MQKATLNGLVGSARVGSMFAASTVQEHPLGTIVNAYDDYWGAGEFIYVYAASTIRQFGLCTLTPTYDSGTGKWLHTALEVPNTAGLAKTVGVAMVDMVAGNYGWLCISGLVPVNCTASVAAGTTFAIAAAGQGGALAAGKQICGANVAVAATHTKAKTGWSQGPSTKLSVSDTNGWFKGIYLSGTGIAATTTVTEIDADEKTVTLSLATTAAVVGTTVTGTYNNATVFYNIVHINRPFAQGQIL